MGKVSKTECKGPHRPKDTRTQGEIKFEQFFSLLRNLVLSVLVAKDYKIIANLIVINFERADIPLLILCKSI